MREGFEGKVPQTPDEFERYFLDSQEYKELQQDIQNYKQRHAEANHSDEFRHAVKSSKHPGAGKATAYRVNFAQQVAILCKRQLQLTRSDMTSFVYRIGSNVLQAVLVGAVCKSHFYPPHVQVHSLDGQATSPQTILLVLSLLLVLFSFVSYTTLSSPLVKSLPLSTPVRS